MGGFSGFVRASLRRRLLPVLSAGLVSLFTTSAWSAPRFIVHFPAQTVSDVDQLSIRALALTGYRVSAARALIQPGSYVLSFDAPDVAADAIQTALRLLPGVGKVHPDFRMQLKAGPPIRPNDPLFSTLQSPYMDGTAYASLRMPEVWSLVRGSGSVIVAVLDTGILYEHPELKGRALPGYDFVTEVSPPTGPMSQAVSGGSNDGDGRDANASDPGDSDPGGNCSIFGSTGSSFHGTAVASVIAANTDNGSGLAGVNGAVRILPVRISGQCGFASSSDILDAMYWAVGDTVGDIPVNPNPARVINLSFSGGLGSQNCSDTVFSNAIARVRQKGAIFVAAAGNSGTGLEFPSSCSGAVAVGAVTPDGRKVGYSSYGAVGERAAVLMAPADNSGFYAVAGNNQLPDGRPNPAGHITKQLAGTSFSTPLVSGLIALLLQARPDWTADQAVNALKSTARAFPSASFFQQCPPPAAAPPSSGIIDNACACTTARCGNGIVAPLAAVQSARAGRPLANVPFAQALSASGSTVLDASASSADSAGNLSYQWQQLNGSPWILQGANTAVLQATPPAGAIGSVRFALQVRDSATGQVHTAATSVFLPGGSSEAVGGVTPSDTAGGGATGTAGDTSTAGSSGSTGGSSTVSAASGGGGGGMAFGGVAGLLSLLIGLCALRVAAAGGMRVSRLGALSVGEAEVADAT